MTQENIEKLIDAALKGDADAANELGDFLMENPTPESMDQALDFFRIAASNGSLESVLKAMFLHNIKAKEAKSAFDWSAVQHHTNEVIEFYKLFLQDGGYPAAFMEKVREEYCEAVYYLATAKYFTDDETGALSLLTSVDTREFSTPLVYTLMGCIRFALANNAAEMHDAYKLLLPLEQLPGSAARSAQDRADQILLAKGFVAFEIILRLLTQDLQRAYDVLKEGYDLISDEACKNILLKAMSHYKTTLLGGMKYVK